ncbi:MAG: acyl-CoA dehydrogenase [Proteobacteria bacterium]|nr:acyl-CoA dehydrogenase [Pseudomonadota bacterium]
MEFKVTREEKELREKVRQMAEDFIRPRAEEIDGTDDVTWELIEKMADEGLFRHVIPKEYGGITEKVMSTDICIIREELSKVSSNADAFFAMQGLASYPLVVAGTEEQKRKYLPMLGMGKKIGAYAVTEPQAGSDVGNMLTEAVLDGDEYVLNGRKAFITNAAHAGINIVFVKTSQDKGSRGISTFIVEEGTPGFRCSGTQEMMAPHALGELEFKNCRILAANLVGEVDKGFKTAMMTFDVYRTSVGACALGFAQAAFDLAVDYAKERMVFGKPLQDFQATKFKIADMAVDLDAARLLVYRAAWLKDSGAARVTKEASMAKLFASEAACRVVDEALQIHGGRGMLKGRNIERLYRQVRGSRIYEGTSEIQRTVISGMILG